MATELGTLRGTHWTHNGRHGGLAFLLMVVGMFVTGVAVALWVTIDEKAGKAPSTGADPLMLPSLIVGLGIGMLLMSGLLGWSYVSRRGEVFRLYQNGLEHTRSGRSRTITWDEIDTVVVTPGKEHALARWAGSDIRCVITPADGTKVTITGLTKDARQLIHEVRAAHERAH